VLKQTDTKANFQRHAVDASNCISRTPWKT